jgi:hypothetical protein
MECKTITTAEARHMLQSILICLQHAKSIMLENEDGFYDIDRCDIESVDPSIKFYYELSPIPLITRLLDDTLTYEGLNNVIWICHKLPVVKMLLLTNYKINIFDTLVYYKIGDEERD